MTNQKLFGTEILSLIIYCLLIIINNNNNNNNKDVPKKGTDGFCIAKKTEKGTRGVQSRCKDFALGSIHIL